METRVAFHTLGCKLNQCETAGIRARFVGAGFTAVSFSPAGPPADMHVVNTCSVTGRADAQARQLVRKLIREIPGSRVVVTGCYAQRAPAELARIPGVFLVAGNGEKDRLHEIVRELMEEGSAPSSPHVVVSDLRSVRRTFDLAPVEFGERTRAFLRVQDGCDAGCTFCIIPRIRGRSTSQPLADAVARARALIEDGFREIVLTGIHLGMYGHEQPEGSPRLADLVDAIHALPGDFRLRLSSIEPQEIDDALIDRIAAGLLAPHLHVPLQTGCDTILAAMNRTYRAADYDAVLRRLTGRIDPIGIGADVIVGFPGESDADFEETYRFIEERPFTYFHVFPFSPRPGTRAASLPGRPPGDIVEERSALLRALSDRKREAFAARLASRNQRVLVEEPGEGEAWEGWSEYYARVTFDWPTGEDLTNRFVDVRGGRAVGSTAFDLSPARQ